MKKLLTTTLAVLTTLFLASTSLADDSEPAMADDRMAPQTELIMVNINEAGAEMLADLLIGVGPSKAALIVEYREANGPFTSAEELMKVRGIGQATVDKNRLIIEL